MDQRYVAQNNRNFFFIQLKKKSPPPPISHVLEQKADYLLKDNL